jgi:hypothetical protein
MRQRKVFVAAGIVVFDFELFIGERRQLAIRCRKHNTQKQLS